MREWYLDRGVDGIVYLDCIGARLHHGRGSAEETRRGPNKDHSSTRAMEERASERQSLISPFVSNLLCCRC